MKIKLSRRLVALGATAAMICTLALSASAYTFIDKGLPGWRNPVTVTTQTLGGNSSMAMVKFSYMERGYPVYVGIKDSAGVVARQVVNGVSSSYTNISYGKTFSKGKELTCFMGIEPMTANGQVVTGHLLF